VAYITSDYYTATYYGIYAGAEFDRLAARASDDIDLATMGQIVVDELTPRQLALLQKATAAQVEFYVINGDTYNDSAEGEEHLGAYSRSGRQTANPAALCARAKAYLEQAGLMNRAVRVLGEHYPTGGNYNI
jgi:hypothetical protein